jgi:hypothetical protein
VSTLVLDFFCHFLVLYDHKTTPLLLGIGTESAALPSSRVRFCRDPNRFRNLFNRAMLTKEAEAEFFTTDATDSAVLKLSSRSLTTRRSAVASLQINEFEKGLSSLLPYHI